VRCSTVRSRPPPRVPTGAKDMARTQGESSARVRARLSHDQVGCTTPRVPGP
jgi:hypothetical protein